MYLQRASGGAVLEQPKQNPVPPKKTAASAGAKPAPQPAPPAKAVTQKPVPHSARTLIAAAGLPVDRLSASIVSFAGFFSLPIKPELMAAIRRQAFSKPMPAAKPQAPAQDMTQEAVAKTREALALAAAAAEGKGVELNPKSLGAYAQAIAPDWRRRQGSGEQDGRRRQRGETGADAKAAPASVGELREMALKSAETHPALAVMNRLPGRDGRRWIVLPFDFEKDGREFHVSMRILLDRATGADRSGRMVLDIAERTHAGHGTTERNWLFALESAGGTLSGLTAYLEPEPTPEKAGSIALELAAITGIPPERVSVKTGADDFPCESSDYSNDLLLSVYEAV